MKTIGIIGGIGPESTIDYYRKIIAAYCELDVNGNYPKIIINSINMSEMLKLLAADRFDEIAENLVAEFGKLAAAGADFGLLASNTPHIIFDKVRNSSQLPLISIVEATCSKVKVIGLQRIALFGTKFTMNGGVYDQVFSQHNIQVFIPSDIEQNFIHEKYLKELVKGNIQDDTKSELLKIASRMKKEHDVQGLILGGTELSLILQNGDAPGMDIIDSTDAHVESILKALE
jgi:aspartate racemase